MSKNEAITKTLRELPLMLVANFILIFLLELFSHITLYGSLEDSVIGAITISLILSYKDYIKYRKRGVKNVSARDINTKPTL